MPKSRIKQYEVKSTAGRLILLATILASGMTFLAATSVTIALPTIQKAFDANFSQIQWVVNSYILALGVLILISGSLGDLYGRKRIFLYGMVIFVVGFFVSGFSNSINQLIAAQGLAGIGAAMMIPGSLAIINASFAESSRGQAIGLWAGLSGGIAALGPLLAGFMIETLTWRSIFFISIPFALIAFPLTLKFVPESRNPDAKRLDWISTILIAVALLGLSYSLINGPTQGWLSLGVISGLVVGLTAFALFLVAEVKIKEPLVPLHIFKNPLVSGANIMTLFLYTALNATLFFLVLNLQQVQGYSPTLAGLALVPAIVLITFVSGPAGSLADKIGPRKPMIGAPLIVAFGLFLLWRTGISTNYFLDYFPGLVLFGLGIAVFIAPLTKSALSVEQKYPGVASGVNNSVARISTMIAVSVVGALLISVFTSSLVSNIDDSELTAEQADAIISQKNKLAAIEIPADFDEPAKIAAESAVAQSFLDGYKWAMAVSIILALLSSVVAFFMIKK